MNAQMPESYNQGLYPGVTEKFIEVTMEGYEKRFKEDASTKGTVSLPGKSVVELNAIDGQIYSYPYEAKEGVNLSFDLEPAGSLVLFVSEKALKGYPAPAAAAGQSKLAAQSPVQVTRLRENALNIDYGSMRLVAERPAIVQSQD